LKEENKKDKNMELLVMMIILQIYKFLRENKNSFKKEGKARYNIFKRL